MSVTEMSLPPLEERYAPGQLVKVLADHVSTSAEKSRSFIGSMSDKYYVFGKGVSNGYIKRNEGGSRQFEAIVT